MPDAAPGCQRLSQFSLETVGSLQQLSDRDVLQAVDGVLSELRALTDASAVLLFDHSSAARPPAPVVLRASATANRSSGENPLQPGLHKLSAAQVERLCPAGACSATLLSPADLADWPEAIRVLAGLTPRCLVVPLLRRGQCAGLLVVMTDQSEQRIRECTVPLQVVGQTLLDVRHTVLERIRNRRQRRLLESIADCGGDGAVLLSPSAQVLSIAATADRRQSLPSRSHFLSWIHADDRERLNEAFLESGRRNSCVHCRARVLTSDRSAMLCQVSFLPRERSGARHRVAVLRMSSAPEALRIGALQHEVHRASRLRLLGRMSADFVHSLNQPLQVLMADSDTLQAQLRRGITNRAVIRDSTERLSESMQSLSDTVQGIARYTRFRELLPEPVSLHDVIQTSVALALLLDESARSTIVVRIPPERRQTEIEVDRLHMLDALCSLLINGLEAAWRAGDNRPRLEIAVDAETRNGFVAVQIADQGPGFPFDPSEDGFQSHESAKEEGFGLGLAISHGVVSAHGGEFRIANIANAGCVVSLTLPLSADAAQG